MNNQNDPLLRLVNDPKKKTTVLVIRIILWAVMLFAALFFLSVGNIILDIIVILGLAFYVTNFIRAQKKRKELGNAPKDQQVSQPPKGDSRQPQKDWRNNGVVRIIRWTLFIFMILIFLFLMAATLGVRFLPQIFNPSTQPNTAGTQANTNQESSLLNKAPYVDSAKGFSIDLPNGWAAIQSTSGQDAFAPNGNGNANEAIVMQPVSMTQAQAQATSLDSVMSKAIQKFQTYPNYKFIRQWSASTGQNVPAAFLDFEFTFNGKNIISEVMYVIKGNTLYSVDGSTLSSLWDNDKSLIEQSMQTFKVL